MNLKILVDNNNMSYLIFVKLNTQNKLNLFLRHDNILILCFTMKIILFKLFNNIMK